MPPDHRRLQVLFLTQGGEMLPSVRFRVLPYVALGSKMGLDARWQRIPKSPFTRIRKILGLAPAEVIVVQKKLLQSPYLKLLRTRCRRLYYDVDDAVWTRHPGATQHQDKDRRRFASTCRQVDGVIAGNTFLAERARRYQPWVTILPTPIDTTVFRPGATPPAAAGPFVVGWMGTAANQHFLPDVLARLTVLPQAPEIRVISNEDRLDRISANIVFQTWSGAREIDQLRGFHVGLMPLSDDEYTRGKCGFKLLQYMACGVVPVASAVGFNREIIDHGVDGFLVREEADWGRWVALLQQDPRLLAQMAAKARAKVMERFDLKPSAERLWQALGLQPDLPVSSA
jgi:glycosyltransferase involved in cell wall biosynthesis